MSRTRAALGAAVGVLGVVLVLAAAAPASARPDRAESPEHASLPLHASLLSTEPASGEVLDTSPERVLLVFNERVEISPETIQLYDSSGEEVELGDLSHPDGGGAEVAASVPELEEGAYVVAWKIVSADSHPIGGAFIFAVGASADVADADAEALMEELLASRSGDRTVGVLYGVVRFVSFAGMVLLVGGGAFVLWLWRDGLADSRTRHLVVVGWVVVLVTTLLSFGFQGAYTEGDGLAGVVNLSLVGDVVGTRTGTVWLVRLGLLGLLAVVGWPAVLDDSGRARRALGSVPVIVWALFGLGLLATISLAGHAAAGDLVPLAISMDVIHLAAVMFWLGGLVFLLGVVLRPGADRPAVPSAGPDPGNEAAEDGEAGGDDMDLVVSRFSAAALWTVVTIVVTGSIQAWRQIGTVEGLTDTTYGRLVITKVLLLSVMLAAAYFSRQWVHNRFSRAAPVSAPGPGAMAADELVTRWRPGVAELRRSVAIEALVAAGILAVTAILVNTVPAEDDLPASTFNAEAHAADFFVRVEVDPAKAGVSDIRVQTFEHSGAALQPEAVRAFLTLPARDLGPILLTLEPQSDGSWLAEGAEIPFPGTWQLEVEVRVSEFGQDTVAVEVPVR